MLIVREEPCKVDYLADLNEPQRTAVTHVDGPLLVLAGPGSGKTRVITRRIAHLVQQGVAPWNILALTFTNKAAGEMAERVASLGTPRGATVCTFHSLCARLLREFATEAGLQPNFSIYDTTDQMRVAKVALAKAAVTATAFTPAKVLAGISRAKMELLGPSEFEATAETFATRNLAKAYAAYQAFLRTSNALDFDDLLMRMAHLLRDRPDIRRLLAQRYRYILIDEYQDTNHAQYVIAHGIGLDHTNICATGDPDQSIYSWRGADVGNILAFESDYPEAVVVRLEENYRSTAPILDAAGRLIARNVQRKPKELYTRRAGGRNVRVLTTSDEHAEAAAVVDQIRTWAAEGVRHDAMAVFYRLNSLSRVLEEAFRRHGVPYRVARGVAFYQRKEIKDLLAYLKLLVNPRDDVACERIINVPARGIGATTIQRLRTFADDHGISLYEAACQVGRVDALGKSAVGKVIRFAELIGELRRRLDDPVAALMEAVIEQTGLEADLRAHGSEDGSELANVEELVSSAADFDRLGPGRTLADYLQQVALVSDVDRLEGTTGAVTLMTLHAAKGLEFDAVILVGCERGLLPFQRALEDGDEEEERRLCFVGMTRAREALVLTHARYRGIRGARQRQIPSNFLMELAGDHVDCEDLCEPAYSPEAPAPGPAEEIEPWDHPDAETLQEDDFYDPDEHADQTAGGALRPGVRVRHAMFGIGRVEKLGRAGAYGKVVVDFYQAGRKTLILQYARLEVLH
ncbi:MAG: UvrD-helicase domain-containing protein [Planctomycetes bacterium]|nr:UvrD-helicase domain-containing protein [Planctomycetota bacterium]